MMMMMIMKKESVCSTLDCLSDDIVQRLRKVIRSSRRRKAQDLDHQEKGEDTKLLHHFKERHHIIAVHDRCAVEIPGSVL